MLCADLAVICLIERKVQAPRRHSTHEAKKDLIGTNFVEKYLEEAAITRRGTRRELDRFTYVHKLDQLNGEDIERELSLTGGTMCFFGGKVR
ncbi:hypothetical protein OIU85_004586 [Salix viminalis]|uniref:Uncharacterized protein n=1 Tax=Salix viminalis TaxID=40686 RepID=A0A9Q0PST8_SALVM|nr:hypothetical protein OIU85_004586 [Salix viminalis]